MTDLRSLALELIERSPRFEIAALPEGLKALERLGTLAELARASLQPAMSAHVPAQAPIQSPDQTRSLSQPAQGKPQLTSSTTRTEYEPALQDPHLVEALMQLHAQAYHATRKPIRQTRPGSTPQIFRPLK